MSYHRPIKLHPLPANTAAMTITTYSHTTLQSPTPRTALPPLLLNAPSTQYDGDSAGDDDTADELAALAECVTAIVRRSSQVFSKTI